MAHGSLLKREVEHTANDYMLMRLLNRLRQHMRRWGAAGRVRAGTGCTSLARRAAEAQRAVPPSSATPASAPPPPPPAAAPAAAHSWSRFLTCTRPHCHPAWIAEPNQTYLSLSAVLAKLSGHMAVTVTRHALQSNCNHHAPPAHEASQMSEGQRHLQHVQHRAEDGLQERRAAAARGARASRGSLRLPKGPRHARPRVAVGALHVSTICVRQMASRCSLG